MMIVALLWELARTADDLRNVLRALVAGSWILALLTLAEYRSIQTIAAEQLRITAFGQDPNDVARFLILALPAAALLARCDVARWLRWLAMGYLPVALAASLLTASRSGLVAAVVAAGGCGYLLLRQRPQTWKISLLALPVLLAALWIALPSAILARLETLPGQLRSGNLNERVDIWTTGWQAFAHAPLLGYGAGNFTLAAGVGPEDTAHNTPLALLVAGGLGALFLATLLAVLLLRATCRLRGPLRTALFTTLAVFALTSMVASAEENRITWLLVAWVAVAERLHRDAPASLAASFPEEPRTSFSAAASAVPCP